MVVLSISSIGQNSMVKNIRRTRALGTEPRGAPGGEGIQPRCTVPCWYLVGIVVESATAKRSNECNVIEYDTAKKRFKLVNEKGKEL